MGLVTAHQHHRAFASWMTWRMRGARRWRRRCINLSGYRRGLLHGTKHSMPKEARKSNSRADAESRGKGIEPGRINAGFQVHQPGQCAMRFCQPAGGCRLLLVVHEL